MGMRRMMMVRKPAHIRTIKMILAVANLCSGIEPSIRLHAHRVVRS